jgi:hypothetical protein
MNRLRPEPALECELQVAERDVLLRDLGAAPDEILGIDGLVVVLHVVIRFATG